MAEAVKLELDIPLDVFGQQSALYKLYTQVSFAYPSSPDTSGESIDYILTSAFQRLSASFPWIGGRVVKDHDAKDGVKYRIRARQNPDVFRSTLQDYRHDSRRSFEALEHARWPMSMLNEEWLCTRTTLNLSDDENTEALVLDIQVSLVRGGVIVTFVGQHNVLDMTGLAEVIRLFDKVCRGDSFTDDDLRSGNSLIQHRMALLEDNWRPDAETLLRYTATSNDEPTAQESSTKVEDSQNPLAQSSWACFDFPSEALAALKSEAHKSKADDIEYITTDDVLTALIWKSVSAVRESHTRHTGQSTLGRAVDPRGALGMPQNFPGFIQNMVYHDALFQDLRTSTVGEISSELRRAIRPSTSALAYTTRALATLLDRAENKTSVGVTAKIDMSKDIAFSSWSKCDLCNLDFGLSMGPPVVVRRPSFTPVEGLIYLMPKARDGSIVAAICLKDDDMLSLRSEKAFAKYAVYLG